MKKSDLSTHKEMIGLVSTSHKESAARDHYIQAHTKFKLHLATDDEAEKFISMYKPFERIYVAESIEEIGNKRAQMATELVLKLFDNETPPVLDASIVWPKNLKKITVESQIVDISATKWPRTLKSLRLKTLTTTFNNLPQSISDLYLSLANRLYGRVEANSFSEYNLSPFLESIEIYGLSERNNFYENVIWPQNLKSLALTHHESLGKINLPNSLETFVISGQIEDTSIEEIEWPQNLQNLKIYVEDIYSEQDLTIETLRPLPASLKLLWWKYQNIIDYYNPGKEKTVSAATDFAEILRHVPNLEIFVFDAPNRLDIAPPNFKIFVNIETFKPSQTTLPITSLTFLNALAKKLFPKVMTDEEDFPDLQFESEKKY